MTNPSLSALAVLAGRWNMEIHWSPKTHALVGGPAILQGIARFEWIEGGSYLLHTQGSADAPPEARWLIGRDEKSPEYCVLYSDARGISRVYTMTFDDRIWRIRRDAFAFDHKQRFEARLSDDDRTITGKWERSTDGNTWDHDFD